MDRLTIESMQIKADSKLNNETKKALVAIVESEFSQKATLYNKESEDRKDKILEDYKKSIGFSKLRSEYLRAERAVELAKSKLDSIRNKIKSKGLDAEGDKLSCSYSEPAEVKRAVDKLEKLLRDVEGIHPNNIKNKIVSRLWLAETYGEACVILRQVLGNGIIPSISSRELLTSKGGECE